MDKEHALSHLRAAKTSHVRWVQRAKLLINGLDIQKGDIPIDSTCCDFGKWFYNDAQKLNALSENSVEHMTKIEKLHFDLHDKYLSIFNIYFGVHGQSFFSRLLHRKKEISTHDISRARHHYSQLEEISNTLINEINILERKLLVIPQETLSELI